MSVTYKHGRWYAILNAYVYEDGVRKRKPEWVPLTARTKDEAKAEEAAIRKRRTPGSDELLGDYMQTWLASLSKRERPLRDSTLQNYRYLVEQYLGPLLGPVRLCDLSPEHIEELKRRLRASPSRRKDADGNPLKLSPVTQKNIINVILMVAEAAARQGLVAPGLLSGVTLPLAGENDINPLDEAAVQMVLHCTLKHGPLYRTLLYTGLRRGEACGLQWGDLDLRRKTLRVLRSVSVVDGQVVVGPTKNQTSRRVVAIPQVLADELAALPQSGPWVFSGPEPYNPDTVSSNWYSFARSRKLSNRLHDLRHTHATWLLREGVPLIEVSHRLGHADVSITASVYAHWMPGRDHDVAEIFARQVAPGETPGKTISLVDAI